MSVLHASRRTLRGVVALSAAAAAVFVASAATVWTLYAAGREDAIEDNWAGGLLVLAAGIGLVGSLVAFAGAAVARLRGDRRAALWLPLLVLPAILLFVILGEAFWWE
jgi:hypothetical protein